MKASLRALLSEIIDYAGILPPASLSLDEVRDARQRHVISFSSCSFDEPRVDSRRLGLL
jgi:hypothetical protein